MIVDVTAEHNIWLIEDDISYFWGIVLWSKLVEFGIYSSIWSVQIGY